MSDKYILSGKEAVPVDDLIAWATWFETADRTVARTEISPEVRVSTVFLGLDHSFGHGLPMLFETMVFGGEHDQYQERYMTWEGAERGHQKAVEMIKTGTAIETEEQDK